MLAELNQLYEKKSHDYGSDSDPLENLAAAHGFGVEPWVGAVIRANDKMHRIQTFVKRGVLANEPIEDALIDMAAYSILALILMRENAAGLPLAALAAEPPPAARPAVYCKGCGKYFTPTHRARVYHDDACRKLAYYYRAKAKPAKIKAVY